MENEDKKYHKLAILIIKIVWGIFCLVCLIANCPDFFNALKHPELYPFGAEAVSDLWWYNTQKLYLLSCVIWFFWFAVGLLFCLLQHKFQKLTWGIVIHLFLTLLYVVIINLEKNPILAC